MGQNSDAQAGRASEIQFSCVSRKERRTRWWGALTVIGQVLPATGCPGQGTPQRNPRKLLWALWVLDVDPLLIGCEALGKSPSLSQLLLSYLHVGFFSTR